MSRVKAALAELIAAIEELEAQSAKRARKVVVQRPEVEPPREAVDRTRRRLRRLGVVA